VLLAIGLGGWLLSTPALEAANWPAPLTFISPIGDPQFSLNKAVNNPAPRPGDQINYTLSYANTQPGAQAFNVKLYDFLPAGLQFISSNPPATLDGNGILIFTVPSVGPGTGLNNVTVQARVLEGYAQLNNHALIVADGVTPTVASLLTNVTQPSYNRLRLAKHGYAFALPNTELIYTLQATNLSPDLLPDVTVVDVMPPDLPLAGVAPPPEAITWPMLRWSLGSLGPGQSAAIAITTTAPAATGVITNSVVGSAWQNMVTQTLFSTHIISSGAILRVSKSASPSVVGVGDTLVYTVRYANAGNQSAAGVRLTDTLPAGLTIVAVSRPADLQTAQQLAWNVGALNAGEQGQIVITTTVGGLWGRNLHNAADISGGAGSYPDHFELNTEVRPARLLLPILKKLSGL
jgi:uncharacterized repeat protein (TIGR01451 family)